MVMRRFGFSIDDRVLYQPGEGTYGYEDAPKAEGRVRGIVIGFSAQRVRCRFDLGQGRVVTRAVAPDNLRPDPTAAA